MKYYVSPPPPTDWRMDPMEFREALLRQWPEAEVTDPLRSASLDLSIDQDGMLLDGRLSQDGQFVALNADVSTSARLARWLRSIVRTTRPPFELRIMLDEERSPPVVNLRLAAFRPIIAAAAAKHNRIAACERTRRAAR